ncbi:MAG TPA: aminotransferase class I/II-fold pyridoxal phosphate-dependent enzyme, partial [Candidatus Baltobacteraceae bacterium]
MTPKPIPAIESVPATTPFIAPEALARRAGITDLLRLGANESPFGCSPRALEAMREAAAGSWMYCDPENTELREALAQRHHCGPESISVGAGIDDLLALTVRAYLGDGTVALTFGTYPTFGYFVAGYGGRAVTVPYQDDGRVALAGLAALAHQQRARMVYLANPDNPSGSYANAAEVAQFIAALPEETIVVLDEAYVDFVEGEADNRVDPRIIRVRTFSKVYGMAGARIAYAVAAPEVVATFQKIR